MEGIEESENETLLDSTKCVSQHVSVEHTWEWIVFWSVKENKIPTSLTWKRENHKEMENSKPLFNQKKRDPISKGIMRYWCNLYCILNDWTSSFRYLHKCKEQQ